MAGKDIRVQAGQGEISNEHGRTNSLGPRSFTTTRELISLLGKLLLPQYPIHPGQWMFGGSFDEISKS